MHHRLIDRRPRNGARSPFVATICGLLMLAVMAPMTGAASPTDLVSLGAIRPSIQYEEALAHADDRIAFAPGAQVTVPFEPRPEDDWAVGGTSARVLPAGRLSGEEIREAPPGTEEPSRDSAAAAAASSTGPLYDSPIVDPEAATPAVLAAAVDPGGLRREVFGFLPYWELTDSSTTLDWEKLSTIAYFGVGAAANGNLETKNRDGSTSVGWSGWTSSKMTGVIERAHANNTRVVLTIQSFAWNSSGVTKQKALLGSATARENLARQVAAAVRDRGADGVNLDVEPIVSGYAEEFTALVREVRAQLDAIAPGYQLTFDAMGYIGNYPIEAATGPGAADAVVIMGYDYKGSSSGTAGSIAPLGGPAYDIADTLAAYTSRIPASRVILGVPYYGRAWSTASNDLNAATVSAAKYGSSVTALYETALELAAANGRQYDPVEGVAWTTYQKENCSKTYGCVTSWRQLYYDDAKALAAKYDLVNDYNIRGIGIWALGYDGSRPELYALIKDKFITDTIPPAILASRASSAAFSPNGDGRLDAFAVRVRASGLIRFGWRVQPFIDGAAEAAIIEGETEGSAPHYIWDGKRPDGTPAPDGVYRVTMWMADASNNRSAVGNLVTLDSVKPELTSLTKPVTISPNGDRRFDAATLAMTASELVHGRARLFDATGNAVRTWKFTDVKSGTWQWDATDAADDRVKDGRYTFRLDGVDAAGNGTVLQTPILVDRTIADITWARRSFRPGQDEKNKIELDLIRAATVSVNIYNGKTLVRRALVDKPLPKGTWTWAWNGLNGHRELVEPGVYTATVIATSWVGVSRLTRTVTVEAP
jgi:spore germination protein YaaH/flagellar hook assembly protein FlgD